MGVLFLKFWSELAKSELQGCQLYWLGARIMLRKFFEALLALLAANSPFVLECPDWKIQIFHMLKQCYR